MDSAFVVLLAFALGGLVHTAAGFGSALVAVPLMCLVMDVRTAAPVEALLGMVIAGEVWRRNRHAFRWRDSGRLVAGALIGTPLGTWALWKLPADLVLGCLGVLLLGYGVFELRRENGVAHASVRPERPWVSWSVGICAGILGGAYTTNGPPLILYGTYRRWSKETFKSVLQSCFLVGGVFIVACHGASGLITRDVLRYVLWGLPGLVGGMALGTVADERLNAERFRMLILMLALGGTLLARAALSAL